MTLSISIAEKLLLLAGGQQVPASRLKHPLFDELIEEGILVVRLTGRTKKMLYITDNASLYAWLHNRFSISDLNDYIRITTDENTTRSSLIAVSNDSKVRTIRTFKGFMVNSYMPVDCHLNGTLFTVLPHPGSFHFIYDFEQFTIPPDVVVIGVENPENFRLIEKQKSLFPGYKTLFICRYPQNQSRDFITWLLSIPNQYLHFGDFDFAGINIYMQEYKKHLGPHASFFIPANIDVLIEKYGNRALYDKQQLTVKEVAEPGLQQLILLIHKHKRGLEQEALLIG